MDPTTIIFIVLLVVLVIALLVVPMFTNKKRAKQTDELHRSLQPGDLIKTVGGIIGTIKEIRQISPTDREMIIETGEGDNKTTMTFDIQALYQVMSRSSTIVPAKDDDAESAESEKVKTEETAPRVVPDILADRVSTEETKTETETVDSGETAATENADVAKESVGEEKTTEVKESAEQEKQAPAPAQKKSGGAKKSGGSAKKSK